MEKSTNNIRNRIVSIDITRGLVMLIMAIDHIRDLMYNAPLNQNPLDLSVTTPGLFFTRWITHLCAPIFVFLSGASAYLSFKRKQNVSYSRNFLITRGIWLIILEFTLITFAVWADIHFRIFMLQVIATIGFGFIILSFLLKLTPKTIMIMGLVIVLGHDLIQTLLANQQFPGKSELAPLLVFTVIPLGAKTILLIAYPILPWLGIMLLGFGTGKLFEMDLQERKKFLLRVGILLVAFFIILRWSNLYGDPFQWKIKNTVFFTFLSFINVSKYPPSLLYTLITLGIMCFILYISESASNYLSRILIVYGKVPLFYYLLHWYLIHTIMFLILFAEGFHTTDLFPNESSFGRPLRPNGVSLPVMYLIWLSVIIILYPLCKWYGKYKADHPGKKWLSYL